MHLSALVSSDTTGMPRPKSPQVLLNSENDNTTVKPNDMADRQRRNLSATITPNNSKTPNTGNPKPANAGKGNTEGDTHVANCATQTPNMPTAPSTSPSRPFLLLFFSVIFRGLLQT